MSRTIALRMGTMAVTLACLVCFFGCEDNYVVEKDEEEEATGGQPATGGTGGTGGTATDGGTAGTGGTAATGGTAGTGGTIDAGDDTDAGEDPDAGEDAEPPPPPPEESVDRSHLSDMGMTGSLDYEDPAMWVCRPEHEYNFCMHDMSATEMLPDGSRQVIQLERAENPEFDCFYVYPTVLLTGEPQQTDFSDISIVHDPVFSQAVPFTQLCEMYAPLYRQVGLGTGATPIEGSDGDLALQDVRDAFAYYLENLNQGRNFVLMGHSQGTMRLTSMMQEDVDDNPDVLSRMISAILLGGRVTVPEGGVVGGTFQNIPICSAQGETGCVVHYVTFDEEEPAVAEATPANPAARFGVTEEEGMEIACANPALLAGNTGRLQGSYLRSSIRNPSFAPDQPIPEGITTPFLIYRDVFRAECAKGDGTSYLSISVDQDPDDQRGIPPYRSALLQSIGFGLHLVDYNLMLDDLVDMVGQQAAAMPE